MLKKTIWISGVIVFLVISNLASYWWGRRHADIRLLEYGYSLGWNEGLSMTKIPGATIVNLTDRTETTVPENQE